MIGVDLMRLALTITLALSLLGIACNRTAPRSSGPIELAGPGETAPVENSGQKLVGTFLAAAVEDQYRREAPPRDVQIKYSFDDAGGFKRERVTGGRTVSVEAGNYVIGTQSELVLYVETANGDNLGAARVERFTIKGLTDRTIDLQYGSGQIRLEKTS